MPLLSRDVWAETGGLKLDGDGTLWLTLVGIGDEDGEAEDAYARLGPIEWHPEVPRGLRGQRDYLLDLWQDSQRYDAREEARHDYLLAIFA